jgi:hypothetical protein
MRKEETHQEMKEGRVHDRASQSAGLSLWFAVIRSAMRTTPDSVLVTLTPVEFWPSNFNRESCNLCEGMLHIRRFSLRHAAQQRFGLFREKSEVWLFR